MEGLHTMLRDEDLEHIREKSQEQEEIKMMARYKQLNLLKSNLENKLDNIEDVNSQEAGDVIN
jgi:hypothetical protein